MRIKISKKPFYSKDGNGRYWYINTYESLGSDWLIHSLEKLGLPDKFVFANFSANAGFYERDAYQNLKDKYNPKFFIGDILASRITQRPVGNFDNFIFVDGDNDISVIDISSLSIPKADVILDCKGALWHTLTGIKCKKKQLENLLANYKKMLKNEQAILLIDFYKYPAFIYFNISFVWDFFKINKKRRVIKHFGERSTRHFLEVFFGKKFIKMHVQSLDVEKDVEGKPLAKYMNTAFITYADIVELEKYVSQMSKFQFKWKRIRIILGELVTGVLMAFLDMLFLILIVIIIYLLQGVIRCY